MQGKLISLHLSKRKQQELKTQNYPKTRVTKATTTTTTSSATSITKLNGLCVQSKRRRSPSLLPTHTGATGIWES